MIRLSASSLARVERCPASASLPVVPTFREDAERGRAIHAEREREEPEGAEVAFALNVLTGQARELGRRLGREYPPLIEGEIPGTTDRMVLSGDGVIIRDFKSGVGRGVAAPAENIQLAFYAVAATRAYGLPAARVEIEYVDQERVVGADLDAFDLAAAFNRIQTIYGAAGAERPPVVTGDHCGFCPSVIHCPAHKLVLQAAFAGALPEVLDPNPALIGETWPLYQAARRALGLYEQAARAVIGSVGPLPLGDGRQLALRGGTRRELDGDVAWQTLRDLHGLPLADAAVERSASKASIERALATVAPKGGKAALVRAAMAAIEARNGVTVKQTGEQFVIEDVPVAALPAKTEAA